MILFHKTIHNSEKRLLSPGGAKRHFAIAMEIKMEEGKALAAAPSREKQTEKETG